MAAYSVKKMTSACYKIIANSFDAIITDPNANLCNYLSIKFYILENAENPQPHSQDLFPSLRAGREKALGTRL